MGTRADFYTGVGEDLKWLGSCAYDGYPDGLEDVVFAHTDKAYIQAVERRLTEEDGTLPEDGWPWPWKTSEISDYAYTRHEGVTLISVGKTWMTFAEYDVWSKDDSEFSTTSIPGFPVTFPDMSARMHVAVPGSKRSGILVF